MNTDKTIYRVLCMQVPVFWEAIKYCCVQADEVPEKSRPLYFSKLLQDLLSDKAQCFLVMDGEKILRSIAITRIIGNNVTGEKELEIQCLYSMDKISNSEIRKYWSFVWDFAVKESCEEVVFSSRNPRIWELAREVNFTEKIRRYSYRVGGN